MFVGTPANLILLNSFLLPTLCVHFAWLGTMAGGATAAVAFDMLGTLGHHRRLAAAILDLVAPGPVAAAILGLTSTLILLFVRLGYPPLTLSGPFLAGTLAPLLAGIALLALYRRLLRQEGGLPLRPLCGLAGIGLVLGSSFLLCCGAGLLVMPEKWPLLDKMPLLLLSWSGTGRYAEFTCLSFAATGALILPLGERTASPDEGLSCRRLGGGMALVFLLAWPPVLLFTQFNLPAIALSDKVWLLAASELATAAVGAWLATGLLWMPKRPGSRPLLAVTLALFILWVATDHLARENALSEAARGGIAAVLPAPAEARKPAPGAAPSAGAAVFERICKACHRFDARLVGPPLNSVVPKYRKDPEALRAFIRDPVKRNPDYPAMPKLPLTEAEVGAVAAYLLEKAAP